jgi:hypothetical protein
MGVSFLRSFQSTLSLYTVANQNEMIIRQRHEIDALDALQRLQSDWSSTSRRQQQDATDIRLPCASLGADDAAAVAERRHRMLDISIPLVDIRGVFELCQQMS